MRSQHNPYKNPLELLLQVLQPIPTADLQKAFSPTGPGVDYQEVVSANRVESTEDLLDSFSFGEDPVPSPERQELWVIFQWHPATKQLIQGSALRQALMEVKVGKKPE